MSLWTQDGTTLRNSRGQVVYRAATAEAAAERAVLLDEIAGAVIYADPKNKKYPIQTEEHVRAAISYISVAKNAAEYPLNGVTLAEVKGRIRAAAKKFGIKTDL